VHDHVQVVALIAELDARVGADVVGTFAIEEGKALPPVAAGQRLACSTDR
jgi:hypothetical protein